MEVSSLRLAPQGRQGSQPFSRRPKDVQGLGLPASVQRTVSSELLKSGNASLRGNPYLSHSHSLQELLWSRE